MGREAQQAQSNYTVEQLVAVNPYNPDILPDLENYVNEQVLSQKYSIDTNLCLLRLYQFEPERMSSQIVAHILVKALMWCTSNCSAEYACQVEDFFEFLKKKQEVEPTKIPQPQVLHGKGLWVPDAKHFPVSSEIT